MKPFLVLKAILLLICLAAPPESSAAASDRPNILWIVSEDNSPCLGCYGDKQADTPNLDKLATQGVRYRNAFANAPVCSSARSTLITGMYATTLGIQHHRSSVAIPGKFKLYCETLHDAGYYCTNNSKKDYNIAGRQGGWDVSSDKAHYRNRRPGQPFFAIFNLMDSHEGQAGAKPGKARFGISPEKVGLPPYYPDNTAIRRDVANYHDQMTAMDAKAGALLDELDKSGLAEDTIVFYYGDHGGALPRGKRNIHDSGTRVPLIIRIPERLSELYPAKPGEWVDDLVSFVDFAPTVFSLCQIPMPKTIQGQAFLGESKATPRDHVFLYRGRMDERYDTVRSIRDSDFQYIRNYSPHRPWGQHYSYAFGVLPSMRSWHEEYKAGRCNKVQSAYWEPKPGEELYHISGDPFEVTNLAMASDQTTRMKSMREALRAEILATRDTGFIPEGMFETLAGSNTIHDYAQSSAYPLERIVTLADQAIGRDPSRLPGFTKALDDPHPVIRYWAATGCLILKDKSAPAKSALLARLKDKSADVRVVAAEAIANLGEAKAALTAIGEVLESGNQHEILAAQNALDALRQDGLVSLNDAKKLLRGKNLREPLDRIPKFVRMLQ